MNSKITPQTEAPKPLPCRLAKLLEEWKQVRDDFKKKGNDEAMIAVEACAENLNEVLCGFFADMKTLRERAPTGLALIAAERQRQLTEEGWTPEHDDKHENGELRRAAAAYALNAYASKDEAIPACWPWSQRWWKPDVHPIRNLVKAGALIAAEIDRLQRLQKP